MFPVAYTPGVDRAHPAVILSFERASARAEVAMVRWRPSATVTRQDQFILKRLEKRRKLFAFLRRDAVEASVFDARWQMVLGRLGETEPAFSQGALQAFRERLIANDMD